MLPKQHFLLAQPGVEADLVEISHQPLHMEEVHHQLRVAFREAEAQAAKEANHNKHYYDKSCRAIVLVRDISVQGSTRLADR